MSQGTPGTWTVKFAAAEFGTPPPLLLAACEPSGIGYEGDARDASEESGVAVGEVTKCDACGQCTCEYSAITTFEEGQSDASRPKPDDLGTHRAMLDDLVRRTLGIKGGD